jgi:hypothetical protein
MRPCSILAAAGLTAVFAALPLAVSYSPSSSLPQLTVAKAEAYVTYRRARVATRRGYRRAYRYGAWHNSYYAHPDGLGGYPYSAGHYAYRHVYAPPVAVVHPGVGWNRWGRGWGWGWGHSWGRGFGWGVHRGWRW